ncbi:MAG: class I SAM-dependent methyltransferase [Gammaproteobacteria bacterium]|nr:class I SAM-dependent methyltransferase [Gammaproteobacteria bacterium]
MTKTTYVKGRQKAGGQTGPSMAQTADRHVLYEASVQAVEHEVEFVSDTYHSLRGKRPRVLREDFCGTTNASCEWVREHKDNRAISVDLDPDVLEWGRVHHVQRLSPEQRKRLLILQANVLEVETPPADIVVAFNFSYWTFKTREELKRYFLQARKGLQKDGIFFLDIYGGPEAHEEREESTEFDDFTYIWDQSRVDPVTGRTLCHIHFRFPDKSRINQAFTYDWRLWSIPEVRELLAEAGFSSSAVYWQGTDEDGEADDVFEPVEEGEADLAWIAYIVAQY